nr:PH108-3-94(-) [Vibrio phage 1]
MIKLKLGDIDLNPNMQIPQLNQSNNVAMTTRPTLSGGVAVFQNEIKRGSSLQLIATSDQGWVSKTNRDKLLKAANTVNNISDLGGGIKCVSCYV